VDNSNLTAAMTKTYIGHSDPAAKTGLAIMSEATNNPVHIPSYSVVRLEWDADTVPAPPAPRIYDFKIGNGEASLSWWKRETADSYTIKYGTAPDRLSNTSQADGSVHSKTITGLEAGSTYYFAVTASNSAGESELSNIVSGKIAVPEAPEIVSVHPQDGKVTVIWNSVAGADTYNVHYGTSSGSHTSQADASNVCGFTVEGLTNDVPYYFVVTAGNGKGESAKSAELSATPKENVPVAPHALRAALKSGNKVELTWIPYADKVLPETYEVRRSTQPYANDYVVLASDVSDTAYTDTLPEPGEYYYTVVTKNENGTSFYYSNVASVLNETSAPGEVTDISVIESNGSLRINWSDPSDGDLASVKIFDGVQKVAEVAKGTQMVLLTGLTNGVEYTLTLKTVDRYANTSPGVNVTGTPKSH
ncbi:MAG: fibronectin type III domain-containing protein, partial [Firmicutes bacterium]|nr:fibronectin type III domain-containing protein [Bacillota bacterium]